MTSCPICQKPVDPIRSRSVAVRDGKIVAYCSADCLSKAGASTTPPTRPTPQPAPLTPAAPILPKGTVPKARADLDSGPVIEIIHEPASGVVTSAADPRATPPSGTKRATPPAGVPTTKPEALSALPALPALYDPKADKSSGRPDETPAAADKSSKTAGKTSGGRTPAKVTTEIDPRDVLGVEDGEDGEDGEDDDVPASGSTVRRRRDSFNVKQAEDWLDDEPAEPVRPATAPPIAPERGGRGALIALLVLLLLGAGGWALYTYVYLPRTAASPPPPPPGGEQPKVRVENVEQVTPEKPPILDVSLERAKTLLRTYLQSKESVRLQRAAAVILSRTGDRPAIDRLHLALDKDNLDPPGKLEVATALARAGDKRGVDVLVGMLTSGKRDDVLQGAQRLAWHGDARAKEPLAGFLGITQNRLGAAKELARFADPRAIKVLQDIRADAGASPDHKTEATIALVIAGKRELVPELYGLLGNRHFNQPAAFALAELHDERARPVLEGQLAFFGLRAQAARALRRLDPKRDMTAYLQTLVAMLDDPQRAKDTEHLPIAEAILLLAGPASWADKP